MHFDEKYFSFGGKKFRLTKDAVPTIFDSEKFIPPKGEMYDAFLFISEISNCYFYLMLFLILYFNYLSREHCEKAIPCPDCNGSSNIYLSNHTDPALLDPLLIVKEESMEDIR